MLTLDQILKSDGAKGKSNPFESKVTESTTTGSSTQEGKFKETFAEIMENNKFNLSKLESIEEDTKATKLNHDLNLEEINLEELEDILGDMDLELDELDLKLEELDLESLEELMDFFDLEHTLNNLEKMLQTLLELDEELDLDLESILIEENSSEIEEDLVNETKAKIAENTDLTFEEIDKDMIEEIIEETKAILDLNRDKSDDLVFELNEEITNDFVRKMGDIDEDNILAKLDEDIRKEVLEPILEELSQIIRDEFDLEEKEPLLNEVIDALKDPDIEIFELLNENEDALEDALDAVIALVVMQDRFNNMIEDGKMQKSQDELGLKKTIEDYFIEPTATKETTKEGELKNKDFEEQLLDNKENIRQYLRQLNSWENLEEFNLENSEDDSSELASLKNHLNMTLESLSQNPNYQKSDSNNNSRGHNLLYGILKELIQKEEPNKSDKSQLLNKIFSQGKNNSESSGEFLNRFDRGQNYNREGNLTENSNARQLTRNLLEGRGFSEGRNPLMNNFKAIVNSTGKTSETSTLNLEDLFEQGELKMMQNNSAGRASFSTWNTSSTIYNREAFVERIAEEIMKFASLNKTKDKFTLNLQLKPERLGRLRLEFSSQDGVLRGEIVAQNQQARQIIQENLSYLRDQLEAQGYEFESLDVTPEGEGMNYGSSEEGMSDDRDSTNHKVNTATGEEDLNLLDDELEDEGIKEREISGLDHLV